MRKSSSEVKAEYDYIPSRPEAGETVEFDASRSGGDVVDYRWSFGDGSSGNGREVEHSYESGGWYSARLTVENSEGDTDSTTRSIYLSRSKSSSKLMTAEASLTPASLLTSGCLGSPKTNSSPSSSSCRIS
ncbi:hypothetical protein HRED_03664 [Candidatus Haloredivivus sp. G17]|nr:hypothetical protein HRED_03664 [Candidatus Haloredivivus sp. G17]